MEMEKIINSYYRNDAKKIHKMVDRIIKKLKFYDIEITDFYSLANEIFVDVLNRYDDNSKDFDGFLYWCLMNKFKTEMTKRNRQKRFADKNAISIHTYIAEDGSYTIEDILADDNVNVEKSVEDEEYSDKMKNYLSRLSVQQMDVLQLLSQGYVASEIQKMLYITQKQYEDCYNAIHAYRNIEVLM